MNGSKVTKEMKSNKAITLIALVITIIVLLILAGVSIATLTGNNGMLQKTNEAKQETEIDEWEEKIDVAIINAEKNNLNPDLDDVIKELENSDIIENASKVNKETGTITTKKPSYDIEGKLDDYKKKLTLPNTAETKPFLPEGAKVTEDDLDKGVTIKDSKDNEWVWIEVPKTTAVYPTAGLGITNFTEAEYTKIYNDLKTYTKDYKRSYTDTWYNGCGLEEGKYNELKNKMLKSVYENGGFYIGKYEAGTETARDDSNESELTTPLIQENKYPYNYVTCSQAQELSQQLATGGRSSSLMFGIQWDLVLKHIEEKEKQGKEGKTLTELKSNSTSWGNYYNATFPITKGQYTTTPTKKDSWEPVDSNYPNKPANTRVLLTTGATERNSTLNIYDLAGNVWEWTLEKYTNALYPCVSRGGFYNLDGSNGPASIRSNYYDTSSSNVNNCFRPALY